MKRRRGPDIAFWIFAVVVCALNAGVIYVAIHFIRKFW